ncbi:MAG: hypothetical protein KGJ93_01010 [Patescibacteria group bacterium]|nr:hypothetical protein [Patescibacteria group bacterium]
MPDPEKLRGKIPIEDLRGWVSELENAGASNEVVGKFFYDHMKRNVKDALRAGATEESVVKMMAQEGEKMLGRSLSHTELEDLKNRVRKFRERINEENAI